MSIRGGDAVGVLLLAAFVLAVGCSALGLEDLEYELSDTVVDVCCFDVGDEDPMQGCETGDVRVVVGSDEVYGDPVFECMSFQEWRERYAH